MEWECIICGYLHEDDEPPPTCPVCGAPSSKFTERYESEDEVDENGDGEDEDDDDDYYGEFQ